MNALSTLSFLLLLLPLLLLLLLLPRADRPAALYPRERKEKKKEDCTFDLASLWFLMKTKTFLLLLVAFKRAAQARTHHAHTHAQRSSFASMKRSLPRAYFACRAGDFRKEAAVLFGPRQKNQNQCFGFWFWFWFRFFRRGPN